MGTRGAQTWPWSLAVPLAAVVALAIACPALAHPLGNFTVNHYAAIDARLDGVDIAYVLDLAEIPTFQEIGRLDEPAMRGHLGARVREWARGLHLAVTGVAVQLRLRAARIACLPGAGGLPVLRVEEDLWGDFRGTASLIDSPASSVEATYRDTNFPARVGWKEIVVTGREVQASTVPGIDRGSRRLRAYPVDLLQSPPTDTVARFAIRHLRTDAIRRGMPSTPSITFDLSGCRAAAAGAGQVVASGQTGLRYAAESGMFGALFQRLTAGQPGVRVWTVALASAFLLGAYHALTPGHGKVILAAYFIGERGTPAQAVLLGLVVTLTHTSGVFLLGGASLALSRYVVAETLYPGLGVLSGVMLLGMGVSLFRRRLRALMQTTRHGSGPGHSHEYTHGSGHGHAHSHGRHHDHGHHHLPPSHGPMKVRDLLALGVTGGLLPCPSALVVMLAAISIGKIVFGLAVITAFSIGLAGVLTTGGLAMVYGRTFMTRFVQARGAGGVLGRWQHLASPALARLPVFSAAAVAVLGLVIIIQSVAGTWLGR